MLSITLSMAPMGELMLRWWWIVVVRGVAAVLFGVLAIVWPGVTLLALVFLFGIYALIDGVSGIGLAFADRVTPKPDRWAFGLLGLAGVLAGLGSILWPGLTAYLLLVIIAVWALVTGVLQIAAAIRLRKLITTEWLLGVGGALSIVLGLLLLISPGEGALALIVTIAAFAILWGVTLILLGFRLRHLAKSWNWDGANLS